MCLQMLRIEKRNRGFLQFMIFFCLNLGIVTKINKMFKYILKPMKKNKLQNLNIFYFDCKAETMKTLSKIIEIAKAKAKAKIKYSSFSKKKFQIDKYKVVVQLHYEILPNCLGMIANDRTLQSSSYDHKSNRSQDKKIRRNWKN